MVQGLRAYYLIGGVIIQVVQGERMEIGSKKMDYTLRLEATVCLLARYAGGHLWLSVGGERDRPA
jgi:hypothetical protein